MVHPVQSIDVCNSRRKESNAVATMVESIDIISNARATIAKTNPRCTGRLSPRGLKKRSSVRASCVTSMRVSYQSAGDRGCLRPCEQRMAGPAIYRRSESSDVRPRMRRFRFATTIPPCSELSSDANACSICYRNARVARRMLGRCAGGAGSLLAAGALLGLLAHPAVAGPPFVSDDPVPTDTGHFEIYTFD